MLASTVDYTQVLIALITAGTSLATLLITNHTRREIKTPSGTSIGKQVEDVNHTARSNWHTLNATAHGIGVKPPQRAHEERAQVDGLEDDEYETPLEPE